MSPDEMRREVELRTHLDRTLLAFALGIEEHEVGAYALMGALPEPQLDFLTAKEDQRWEKNAAFEKWAEYQARYAIKLAKIGGADNAST